MARQGENTHPPSYTNQVPVEYENKSLKRETRTHADTSSSSAISGANKRTISKASRNTGKR